MVRYCFVNIGMTYLLERNGTKVKTMEILHFSPEINHFLIIKRRRWVNNATLKETYFLYRLFYVDCAQNCYSISFLLEECTIRY